MGRWRWGDGWKANLCSFLALKPPCPLFIKRGCSPMEEIVDGRSPLRKGVGGFVIRQKGGRGICYVNIL